MQKKLYFKSKCLNLTVPAVMGVLNITPDSYYAGSRVKIDTVLSAAKKMVDAGAKILDIGGESTNPVQLYPGKDTTKVSVSEELDRVIPVIELIKKELDVIVSIDTMKPSVMDSALSAGADIINDVNGLKAEGAIDIAVKHQAGVCIMHMQGTPDTMQIEPKYNNVTAEVKSFLFEQAEKCIKAGLPKENICLDPGFCFGKTAEHNIQLLRELKEFTSSDYPVLAGISRKSMVGKIINKPTEDRLYGSISIHLIAMLNGANIIRTHDVSPTIDSVKIYDAYVTSN